MKNEQIMATANNVSSNAPKEILLFQLAPLYSNETRKGCGLLGKEIDANFQYLNGNDIVDFRVETSEEEGRITNRLIIELRNGFEYPVNIDEQLRPDTFEYDPVHGVFTVTRYDGTKVQLTGFLVEGRDVHVVNDGTIDGDGTWANPLSLNPTLKTGVYAPVKQFVDLTDGTGIETLEDFLEENSDKYVATKGLRFLTKEKVNRFGFLYSLRGAKEAVRTVGNGWRIPTLDDWNSMFNYIETMSGCTCDNPHQGLQIRELGCRAGKALKSEKLWIYDEDNFGTDEFGFTVLPLGSQLCNQTKDDPMPDFQKNAYFWTGTDFEGDGAWIKSFSFTNSTIRQEPDTGVRMYSLRLVKDSTWDGVDNEIIGGEVVPCGSFPYVDASGDVHSRLWTLINVAIPVSDGREYRYPTAWEEYEGESEYRSMQPGYFICEFNGQEWKKRQMRDGESVIILDTDTLDGTDDDEKEYAEYRVQWDEDTQEYILVDVLDVFRKEVSETIADLEERVELLETSAHTHDNKEILDAITEERVEKWDNAEANAIAAASAYTDEQVAVFGEVVSALSESVNTISGSLETVVNEIGLDSNLDLDLTAYRYIEISQSELTGDPTAVSVEFLEEHEYPTKQDPEFIYTFSAFTPVFYQKVDATHYIGNCETVVEALKDLDTAIFNEKEAREEATEQAKEEAIESAKEYTDNKVEGIEEDVEDLQNALDTERNERVEADKKAFLKAKDKSISILHCSDGTYINVNVPEIDTADTTPNHMAVDGDGLYFDGFFGILPSEIALMRTNTLLEYMGATYGNITSIESSGETMFSVDWNVKVKVSDGAAVSTPLAIKVVGNLPDCDGNYKYTEFNLMLNPGETEVESGVTFISTGGSMAGDRLIPEAENVAFTDTNSRSMIINENGVSHEYKLKTSTEMANEKIVRYGVKLHAQTVADGGFTTADYENAKITEIDGDNSINVVFDLPSTPVDGYSDMSYNEQEAARETNSYDFFFITDKDVKMTIPANIGNDINTWELKRWRVEGVSVSRRAGNVNIYDPQEDVNPGYAYIEYEIRFLN